MQFSLCGNPVTCSSFFKSNQNIGKNTFQTLFTWNFDLKNTGPTPNVFTISKYLVERTHYFYWTSKGGQIASVPVKENQDYYWDFTQNQFKEYNATFLISTSFIRLGVIFKGITQYAYKRPGTFKLTILNTINNYSASQTVYVKGFFLINIFFY